MMLKSLLMKGINCFINRGSHILDGFRFNYLYEVVWSTEWYYVIGAAPESLLLGLDVWSNPFQ